MALKINEVETLVGITKKNIRFYEEQGLLSPKRNSENGYRDYGKEEISELRRIKLMRKLGVPIEEIRQMQQGTQTVADGMRRHLITLEREEENLKQSIRFCALLKEREERLSTLDAEEILCEMDELERSGAIFQDKHHRDIRTQFVAPVAACVIMVLLMLSMMFVMAWSAVTDPQSVPPLPFMVIAMVAPAVVIIGVILALTQRIREIGKGEIDDAKKY